MRKKLVLSILFPIVFTTMLFGQTRKTGTITIQRNENNGYMNAIESFIIIEKKENKKWQAYSDYIISDFEILDEEEKYDRTGITLNGGEKITLSLIPGDYRIKCITPQDKQANYLDTQKQWESDYVVFSIKSKSSKTISVYPQTDVSGYVGRWVLE